MFTELAVKSRARLLARVRSQFSQRRTSMQEHFYHVESLREMQHTHTILQNFTPFNPIFGDTEDFPFYEKILNEMNDEIKS